MSADDRTAIADRIGRYAKSLDDRDFDAVAACFTPDAHVTYSGVALAPGRQAIVGYLQGLRSLIASTHIMSLPVIDLDGDRAHVETSGLAFLVVPVSGGEPVVRTRGLRYADDFVRVDGAWLIARRVHRCDWMYEGPLAPTTKAT
jgi:ketosteroid isomerase-like protein